MTEQEYNDKIMAGIVKMTIESYQRKLAFMDAGVKGTFDGIMECILILLITFIWVLP